MDADEDLFDLPSIAEELVTPPQPEETSLIAKLPDETLLQIFSYLIPPYVDSLSLVSKHFNRIANELRIEKRPVALNWYSWLFLKRFGSSIKSLHLHFHASAEAVEGSCQLCPNLVEFSCLKMDEDAFAVAAFRETLPRLTQLIVGQLLPMPGDSGVEDALRNCDNVKVLSVGNYREFGVEPSNFEPFFRVNFPSLHQFCIHVSKSSANERFLDFLRTNTTMKSLLIYGHDDSVDIDMSGILALPIEELVIALRFLDGHEERLPLLHTIQPNFQQLSQLRTLRIYKEYIGDFLVQLFATFKHLKQLRTVVLTTDEDIYRERIGEWDESDEPAMINFSNTHLLQVKHLSNLETFELGHSGHSNATLFTVRKIMKHCPMLVTFTMDGLRRPASTENNVLYNRFEEFVADGGSRRWIMRCIAHANGTCKWYEFIGSRPNMVDFFKSISS